MCSGASSAATLSLGRCCNPSCPVTYHYPESHLLIINARGINIDFPQIVRWMNPTTRARGTRRIRVPLRIGVVSERRCATVNSWWSCSTVSAFSDGLLWTSPKRRSFVAFQRARKIEQSKPWRSGYITKRMELNQSAIRDWSWVCSRITKGLLNQTILANSQSRKR
ncbi:hypothetical protein PIB30_036952 [Stylosanthes scabra]|uniref:Uncharacterized protein n=1 Tax=Stylosanthes scabra TaxID=79078 RepID=A0ABU6VFG5_9FABA|nr:hypothetical protein [Stylosanthes scabra]